VRGLSRLGTAGRTRFRARSERRHDGLVCVEQGQGAFACVCARRAGMSRVWCVLGSEWAGGLAGSGLLARVHAAVWPWWPRPSWA
jgi:hypothetical protein